MSAPFGIAFSWVNHVTAQSVVASSEAPGLPAANLVKDKLFPRWRSDGANVFTLSGTFAGASPVRFAGIFGSNLSAAMQWRLRLSMTAVGDGDVTDTGMVAGKTARVNTTSDGDLCQALLILPATVSALHWQLDIDDSAGVGGYRQAGGLWIGDLKFPKFGRSFGGKDAPADPSEIGRSAGGTKYVKMFEANRVASFNLDFLTDEEVNTWVRDMWLTVRKAYPFVVVPEANLPYQNGGAILGTFMEAPESTRVQVDVRSQPWQIEEML
jgi:hypothetical protein